MINIDEEKTDDKTNHNEINQINHKDVFDIQGNENENNDKQNNSKPQGNIISKIILFFLFSLIIITSFLFDHHTIKQTLNERNMFYVLAILSALAIIFNYEVTTICISLYHPFLSDESKDISPSGFAFFIYKCLGYFIFFISIYVLILSR